MLVNSFPPYQYLRPCCYPTTTVTPVLVFVQDATSVASTKEHQSPKKMHCFSYISDNLSIFGGFGSFRQFESGGSSFGCSGFVSFFTSFHFRFLIFTGWWLVWLPWTRPDMRKHVQVPNHAEVCRSMCICHTVIHDLEVTASSFPAGNMIFQCQKL